MKNQGLQMFSKIEIEEKLARFQSYLELKIPKSFSSAKFNILDAFLIYIICFIFISFYY